ncbi:MAG: EAL domain-containing protein [Candidatus Competibacteraceae bacterium]|nr:EAL domain-containing protein [Candidatus Competibacteraceae bacterium]
MNRKGAGKTADGIGKKWRRLLRLPGFVAQLMSVGGFTTFFIAAEVLAASTTTESVTEYFQLSILSVFVLILLGLAAISIIAFLIIRDRRSQKERERQQARIVVLDDRQQQLEAELKRQQNITEALRESEQRFRKLTQQLPVGVFINDTHGECRYVNNYWCWLAGLTAEQAMGLGWTQALHADDREQALQIWKNANEQGNEVATQYRFRTPSGRETWLKTRARPMRDRAGRITGHLGASIDIADLKKTEETLRASEARFRNYFELPLIGIALIGPDKRWWEVNDRTCEMLGYRRSRLLGMTWAEMTHPDDQSAEEIQLKRVLSRRIEGYSLDKRFIRQDGALLYASVSTRCVRQANGMVDHFVTVIQDITERRQAAEHIKHLAYYDALTGLPNRTLLNDRLQQALLRAGREHNLVGMLLVDLDRFKLINDALGHKIGDRLLNEVATRLQRSIRQCDTISRQGGDEFAILLPDLTNNDDATRAAQRMLDAMIQPFRLDGRELSITCSIGISLYPRDGCTSESLLKNADIALYRAKDMGRNNYQFYLSGGTTLSRERLNLETDLRHAMNRRQLELYYQPKWDFRTSAITGAEALIRWNHPDMGLVSPVRFIPIAEENGLVLPIGEWILRVAVNEIIQLHKDGFPGLRIAVNLSGRQFRQTDLKDRVREALTTSGFDPACLELELTEGILMHNNEENMAVLHAFKAMGVRIAIDDFGTGYSSLSYLQQFPVNVLKIDRAFVKDLPENTSSVAIVDAIVTLAHGLELEVVAEGVETPEQQAFLQAHGCDEGQGYYFGRPMPLAEFRELLIQNRLRTAAEAAS